MGNQLAPPSISLEAITSISLKQVLISGGLSKTPILAGTLWAHQPALIYVVRRPGCVFCREHARELSANADKFKELGVSVVGVVHEELGAEEFAKDHFTIGDLYFDEEKAFFQSLGMRWQGLLSGMTSPTVWSNIRRVKANSKENGYEGNFVGEGRLLGGLMIVGAGESGVKYVHQEKVWGDHASISDILAACEAVTKGTSPEQASTTES